MDPITGQMKQDLREPRASRAPTKLERMMMQAGEVTERATASRKRPLSAVEQQEEDEIAWLEHQLYRGQKHRALEGDDVDELLGDLDKYDVAADEDELEANSPDANDHVDTEGDERDDLDNLDGVLQSPMDEDESAEDNTEENSDDDVEGDGKEDAVEEDDGGRKEPSVDSAPVSASAGKYVPPALRAAKNTTDTHSVEQQKLRRHVNGLLNRLGEGNLDTIVGELDGLYRSYARNDVTTTVTHLVLDTIAARTNLSESIVVLYAALLTALHRLVGVEFGACFLQETISRFLRVYGPLIVQLQTAPADASDEVSVRSRECANLVTLLCHLFNLKLVSAGMIYDLVRLVLGSSFGTMVPGLSGPKSITEVDIELLLRIVKSCGAQLRQVDAESLKAIAELTKRSLDDAPSSAAAVTRSSRARFMLETVMNVAQKGRPGKDALATTENMQRMAKYISTLERKRMIRTHAALQVGLQDLQDAEHKGRWWLVGAAWSGRDAADAAAPASLRAFPIGTAHESADSVLPAEGDGEVDLAQLARSQGMNTDARRAVFSTLMSSLDYADAAQNLLQLKLSEVQRREIIRVLVHCVAHVCVASDRRLTQERTYNPYYVLVGERLAQELPGMRVTLQFVLWDYFREIGERRVGGENMVQGSSRGGADDDAGEDVELDEGGLRKLVHLARAYGWWFARGALSLSALKPVDFTALHSAGTLFLQHLLVQVLLQSQTKSPMITARVRERLAGVPSAADHERIESTFVRGTVGNAALAQGLFVFLRLHVRESDMVPLLGADRVVLSRVVWAVGVATNTLSVGVSAAEG